MRHPLVGIAKYMRFSRFVEIFAASGASSGMMSGLLYGSSIGALIALTQGLDSGHDITAGIVTGLVSGIIFGVLFCGFCDACLCEWLFWKIEAKDGVFEDEPVIFQGPASHLQGGERRRGWLILTPSCLVFRRRGINMQNQPLVLSIEAISEVTPVLRLGFIPDGLCITRGRDKGESFVVINRKKWTRLIARQVSFKLET